MKPYRLPSSRRKVVSIAEVIHEQGAGWAHLQVKAMEIFRFERQGVDDDGRVVGRFTATDYQPQSLECLRKAGVFFQDVLME